MIRLFDSIKARVLMALVVFLVLSHLGGLWLYASKHEEAATLLQDALLADRIALISRLLDDVEPAERGRLVAKLGSMLVKVADRPGPALGQELPEGSRPHLFEHLLGVFLNRSDHAGIRMAYSPNLMWPNDTTVFETISGLKEVGPHHLPEPTLSEIRSVGTVMTEIQLADGSWLRFAAPLLTISLFSALKLGLPLLAMLASVIIVATLTLNRWTEPLASLAQAATRFGANINAAPLQIRGSSEVRAAASAFNEMQERIQRLIEDRTAFAAAVAHDLGTPVTRLLLRVDDIADGDVKSRIIADIEQMQRMIKATLGFARMDFAAEPNERFDCAALAQSIADEFSDLGSVVSCDGANHLPVVSKPVAVRRVITNLVENAVKYGGEARLTVARDQRRSDTFRVIVEDKGPGIPERLHEEAFRPFRRIESAAPTGVDGTGLGLTVARAIVRSLGGEITLANRLEGGLRVVVTIPRLAPSAAIRDQFVARAHHPL